jgi:asparagine synthase (glutamine-hydrolysing)
MCGIAGLFSPEGISPEHLKRMSKTIAHRGPDGEGFVFFTEPKANPQASDETPENCIGQTISWSPANRQTEITEKIQGGFAHRRLSIIDLAATGHQPMCSIDGRFWITFNGEIYNYIELREELQKLGARFISQSDTEVVLNAYHYWGEACQHRFNGMWAFAIYDQDQKTLFASRDRFGVKPFYYSKIENRFAFASEQKALLSLPWVPFQVNQEAVFDYFLFSQIEYQAAGFFDGILELPAGHSLTFSINNRNVSSKPWYDLKINESDEPFNKTQNEIHVSRIQELLSDAVRLRLRADVPVGSCLSGGLDSSAIVGWMRKHLGDSKALHVYTAEFPGNSVDEGQWAKMMAQSVNAIQHTVLPDAESLLRDFEALTYCQDVPIWSTSTYAQFRVMQAVKESGIKVVLDGQGGDELFGGYDPHRSFYWKGLSNSEMFREMNSGKGFIQNLKFHFHQQARFDYVFRLPAGMNLHFQKNFFNEHQFLNQEFLNNNVQRFEMQRHYQKQNLNSRLAFEMQNTSLKGYLKCEDRCAMWHGIESRTPFADDVHLIEYLFSVPASYKMHGSQLKALLRDASNQVIPLAIINRSDKQGYTTPNNTWIRKLAPEFKHYFTEALEPYLDVRKINTEFGNLFNPTSEIDTGRIFKFFSFAVWMKTLHTKNVK